MNNYEYPEGADTDSAPWNQEPNEPKELEVTVSVTLSKTVKISITDYNIINKGIDEDGTYFEDVDYSDCNLKKAVEEQIILPQDAWNNLHSTFCNHIKVFNDLKDWNVDDFEVILD